MHAVSAGPFLVFCLGMRFSMAFAVFLFGFPALPFLKASISPGFIMTSSTGTSPMLRPSRSSAGTTWEASCSGDAPPNCGRPYEFTCEHTTDSFPGSA